MKKLELSTDPCLPRPIFTSESNFNMIIAMIAIMLVSCVLDTYLSRLRSYICDQFYEERAMERAKFLYKELEYGRSVVRKTKLHSIVSQEIKRRQQIKLFSFFTCCSTANETACPGCCWPFDDGATSKKMKITVQLNRQQNESVNTFICKDCTKDL